MSESNTIDEATSVPAREWGYPEAIVLMGGLTLGFMTLQSARPAQLGILATPTAFSLAFILLILPFLAGAFLSTHPQVRFLAGIPFTQADSRRDMAQRDSSPSQPAPTTQRCIPPGRRIFRFRIIHQGRRGVRFHACLAVARKLLKRSFHTLRELGDEGMTMLVVTHEIGFARSAAHRVIFMDEGVIIEQGPPSQVLDAPKEERTRQFLGLVLEH